MDSSVKEKVVRPVTDMKMTSDCQVSGEQFDV
jgi:hypothetical protein